MARITSSIYTSHIPAVGAAFDLGKTQEPYWQKVFSGYEFTKEWEKAHTPDVILLDLNMKGMSGLDTLRALRDGRRRDREEGEPSEQGRGEGAGTLLSEPRQEPELEAGLASPSEVHQQSESSQSSSDGRRFADRLGRPALACSEGSGTTHRLGHRAWGYTVGHATTHNLC